MPSGVGGLFYSNVQQSVQNQMFSSLTVLSYTTTGRLNSFFSKALKAGAKIALMSTTQTHIHTPLLGVKFSQSAGDMSSPEKQHAAEERVDGGGRIE